MRINSDDFSLSMAAAVEKATGFFKREKPAALDADAFQELLEPLKDHLYNFISKSMDFSEDAGDVYQDTVMRAFKYRSTFRTGANFKTWIFTIAHNQVKYFFIKQKKSRRQSDDQTLLNLPDDSHNPQQQLIHDVYQLAGQLKPEQRKVFFLFYDQQFSINEISGITGLKEGNIKFILNRCREQIKQMINPGEQKKNGGKNEQ